MPRTLSLISLLVFITSAVCIGADNSAANAHNVAASSATNAAGYRLFPGDLVHIQVFDNPDLETDLRVPDTGTITFPLIGEVKNVVGRSVDDFSIELSHRLMEGYLRQAVVTATIKEFGKRVATVMGSVNHPGQAQLDPLRSTTAMQAIGDAGGFTEDANRTGAQVIRENHRTGEKDSLQIPKGDKASDLASDVVLEPGDIIIVPRLDRVFILGQVTKPGAVNLPSQEPLTVSKAVSLAGGFDKYAKQGDVQLIRSGQRVQVVDVRKILTGDNKQDDPQLKPGDTVYVPESRF